MRTGGLRFALAILASLAFTAGAARAAKAPVPSASRFT
jgi:hypothetical protein